MKKIKSLLFATTCITALAGCAQTGGNVETDQGDLGIVEVSDHVNRNEQETQPLDHEQKALLDLIPMVMLKDNIYIDTGKEIDREARKCGVMDGEITTEVASNRKPNKDNQSNFGTGYEYQYVDKNNVDIILDGKWIRFIKEETSVPVEETLFEEFGEQNTISENSVFLKSYVDLQSLPMLDIDIKEEYIFEDRSLFLENSIDNDIELLTFNLYYSMISGEFDKISLGENTIYNNAIKNEVKNFNDGNYMKSYTLHDIYVLSEEALINSNILNELNEYTLEYNLSETALVLIDVSWEHNEQSLSRGPQLGNGRYLRYYLVGKTEDSEEYKLYEIYWGEYYSDILLENSSYFVDIN